MKNKDAMKAMKQEILARITQAQANNDMAAMADGWNELSELTQQAIRDEYEGVMQTSDTAVLVGRGVRQLTMEENNYYKQVIEAMKTNSPKQALSDISVTLPITTIDAVFEDLESAHPLLTMINFQNTSGLIEFLVNTNTKQLATWGTLTAAVVTELTGGFKKLNMTLEKLSAFLPVAKSMLDLGPVWMDRYVRSMLSEAIAFGLEEAIINGSGKNMPIGMNRQVGEGVTVTDGVYPLKATVSLLSLDPVAYGNILAQLAKDSKGKDRVVSEVILIVNPTDYLKKIMPATTVRSADGTYALNVFPFPTTVVQSSQMQEGKAIIGLAKKYFMGIGLPKEGKIEFDDSYHFLEDERMYLVKLYGHGEPVDNNSFIYLDVSGLTPTIQKVIVENIADTPVA